MKNCPICGTKNFDVDTVCTKCKNPLNYEDSLVQTVADTSGTNTVYKVVRSHPRNSSLVKVAKAFWIVNLAFMALYTAFFLIGWVASLMGYAFLSDLGLGVGAFVFALYFIVGLAAFIFRFIMYRHYSNRIAEGRGVGTAFKIVVLLFISLVVGILLLCDDQN